MSLQQADRLSQVMGLMCQAIACNGAGQVPQALDLLAQALALDPHFIPAHMQRAALLEQCGRLSDALAAYEACLVVVPAFHDARQARQRVLQAQVAQGQAQLAAGDSSAAVQLALAQAWRQLQQLAPALQAAQAALAAAPSEFAARVLVADILLQLNRHEEALQCYAPEGAAGRDHEQTLLAAFNRADILRRMARFDESLALLTPLVAQRPGFAEAQVARAHLLLLNGHYAEGWRAHEQRHAIAALAGRCPCPALPAWQPGQAIQGQHILLWAEQGLGDSLQFARYIGAVRARGAIVTVCVPAGLLALLAPAFPDCHFLSDVAALASVEPALALQAPLMSLPLLLDLPDPAQAPPAPYLQAEPARVAAWQAKLAELTKLAQVPQDRPDTTSAGMPRRLRVGLVWAGRQYAQVNHSRDIPLAQLLPLLALPLDLVALQPELPEADEAVAASLEGRPGRLLRPALGDWADTAALVAQLDLVIAVDTAVAHLAGAMGKPVWLLARHEGEWRWGRAATTPWYPAMRLWRQPRRGHWEELVAQVQAALQERLAS